MKFIYWSFITALLLSGISCNSEFISLTFVEEPSDTVVEDGSQSRLACRFNREDVSYSWLYRGIQGEEAEVFATSWSRMEEDGSLTVNYHANAPGVYRCRVNVPGFGTLVSRAATVQLAELSFLRNSKEDNGGGVKRVGDVALLHCQFRAVPETNVEVKWFYVPQGGALMQPCFNNSKDFLFHNGGRALEIIQLDTNHFERYFCGLRRGGSSERNKMISGDYIHVRRDPDDLSGGAYPLSFAATPQANKVQVKAGSSVTLLCAANGRSRDGKRPRIMWLRGDTVLDVENDSRLMIAGQGSLRIWNTKETDSGRYTCRASLEQEDKFAEVLLEVGSQPLFSKRPSNVVGYTQQELLLSCAVTGKPPPTVEWRKNGEPLVGSEYLQQHGDSLRISGLLPSDQGIFQCLAGNQYGALQAAMQLVVKPRREGQADGKPDSVQGGSPPGPPLALRADNFGFDYIHLIWTSPANGSDQTPPRGLHYLVLVNKKGHNRVVSRNTSTTGQILNYLKADTSYLVRVFSVLPGGAKSVRAAQLTVRTRKSVSRPAPVVNLEVRAQSFGSLNISWEHAPSGYSHLDRYEILLYNLSESDQSRAGRPLNLSVAANQRSLLVDHLTPDAFYRIYVYGVNASGRGNPAKISSSPRVPSRPPSLPPTQVRVLSIGAAVATVTWQPPSPEARNGDVIGYVITLTSKKLYEPRVMKLGNVREHILSDLSPDAVYRVVVAGSTRAGNGPASVPVQFRTLTNPGAADATQFGQSRGSPGRRSETLPLDPMNGGGDALPGMVQNLQATVYERRIDLSWAAPADGVRVTAYKIKYGTLYPGPNDDYVDSTSVSYTIKHLNPATQYYIQVITVNNMGDGQPAYKHVVTKSASLDNAMSIPMNLLVQSRGSNWATISWEDPGAGDANDGRLYQVQYYPVRGDQGQRIHKNFTAIRARLDRLLPATRYEFKVRTIVPGKIHLWSGFSLLQNFDTLGQKPSDAPQDLTLSAVVGQPSAVQVSWQPPDMPNGQITTYVLYLTAERRLPLERWVERSVRGDSLNTVVTSLELEKVYFFRIAAQNKHGDSPVSPIRVYKTSNGAGLNGGPVLLSREYYNIEEISQPLVPLQRTMDGSGGPGDGPERGRERGAGGLSDRTWWIIIGSVFGAAMLLIVVILVVICRCKRTGRNEGYKAGSKVGKGGEENGKVTPVGGLKPPDLFIHTEGQFIELERRNSDSVGRPSDPDNDSVRFTSVSQRHLSDGPGFSPGSSSGGGYPPNSVHHPMGLPPVHPASMMPGHYPMHGHLHPGNMMHHPGQQSHHRMGSLGQPIKPKPMMIPVQDAMQPPPREPVAMVTAVGMGGGRGMSMGRPYPPGVLMSGTPNPPRVNASELASHTSSEDIRPLMQASTLSEGGKSGGNGSFQRHGSHSKKKPPIGGHGGQKGMRHHDADSVPSSDADLAKGYSTEELTQEMANLEGLMKDLNAITQKEFEC